MSEIKSAARALEILELLADFPQGLTLSAISERLNIPHSSLHGLLGTLAHKGYVIRDENSRRFQLGPALSRLAGRYYSHNDVISFADPVMTSIRDQADTITGLTVLDGDDIVFIHKKASSGIVQIVNPVGTRLPAHATGSGKVMLAHLPEAEIDRLYPREKLPVLTPNTLGTKSSLKAALNQVRQQGYAYDNEESQIGVWAVASCIRNFEGASAAALSIVAPSFQVTPELQAIWQTLIVEGARKISMNLGYTEAE